MGLESNLTPRFRNAFFSAHSIKKGHNMNRFDRITVNPAVVSGQPCIRGMRLTVKRVLEAVALYPNREELQREYPELEAEDIRQALDFAACNLDDRMIHLEAA